MALSDYKVERRPIEVKGEVLFHVQGISLEALTALVKTHLPDLEHLFGLFMAGESLQQSAEMTFDNIALAIVTNAPGLTANILAVCSGEDDIDAACRAARSLPFPVQLEALVRIGELTFEEVGGIKKAAENLEKLLSNVNAAKAPFQSSSTSTEASDAT